MGTVKTMNRWWVVLGAILIQLALGAIYSWSVFTKALTAEPYAFSKTQTQIIFSVGLASFAFVMVLAGQLQLDAGAAGAHGAGQPRHQIVGRHSGERDPHQARLGCARRTDRQLGPAHRRQHVPSGVDQRPAARGEAHRPGVALEQPGSQFALQLLDRAAQRWLRHVQPLCGPAEMQLLGHGEKSAELVDVH